MQVFPGKYGDNKARLFVYWTVSKFIEVTTIYCNYHLLIQNDNINNYCRLMVITKQDVII